MGVVTAIAVGIFLLVRSNKLGFVGDAFRRQMQRFTARRTFRKVLIISVILNIYMGGTLYLMDRGEFHFEDERLNIEAIYVYLLTMQGNMERIKSLIDDGSYPSAERMIEVGSWGNSTRVEYADKWLNDDDFALSVTAYETNMVYGGWPSHFNTVMFVEELEAVGLWFLYRRWYYKPTDAIPWTGFDKNIKRIMYRKTDNLENVHLPNLLLLKFVGLSIAVGVATYILTGTTFAQTAGIILAVFATLFGALPKITRIKLKPHQRQQFKKFRFMLLGMVIFFLIVVFRP